MGTLRARLCGLSSDGTNADPKNGNDNEVDKCCFKSIAIGLSSCRQNKAGTMKEARQTSNEYYCKVSSFLLPAKKKKKEE